MKQRGISQEMLKLIACITMLLDHIGATLVPGWTLRIMGRIAFPIYCFLLAEGAHYTRNPKKYALRLAIGAVLSELPFDLAFFGGWTWGYQSVMLTMLVGFFALQAMAKCQNYFLKCLVVLPFALLAEWMLTDYGGAGVLLIAMFGISRELSHKLLIQFVGMALICNYLIPGSRISIGNFRIAIELFALLALIPIALYSGRKVTTSKVVQWGFYLFYPVHLTVLYLIKLF